MQDTKTVEPKTRHKAIMHEILAAFRQLGALSEISSNSQDLTRPIVDGHDVRQRNAGWLTVRAQILEAFKIKFDVNFQKRVSLVVGLVFLRTLDFIDLVTDLVVILLSGSQINVIAIETSNLQFANLIRLHLKAMCDARRSLEISR